MNEKLINTQLTTVKSKIVNIKKIKLKKKKKR